MSGFDAKGYAMFTAAIVGAVVIFRAMRGADTIIGGVNKIVEGLTFNPESLGPVAELTPGAVEAQNEYIRLGYLVRLADGRTRITPLGEAYIAEQNIID